MITVLCGGVGGSRMVRALVEVVGAERVTAIINTGDDDWFHGLYVSPDPDIITYALAGEVNEDRGWGLRDDTFRWLDSLARFGHETWFRIGDRDLATHVHRTRLLREGHALSNIIAMVATAFRVRSRLLPMSDDRVRTVVDTAAGALRFQEYLVKRGARDDVRAVRYEGVELASPAPGVLDAIAGAEVIVIAPSNPIASIEPILAVPGVREAVITSRAVRIGVSPLIGGKSLQPPTAEMMAGVGARVDAAGVAERYAGLIDTFVIDEADARLAPEVKRYVARSVVTQTLMPDLPNRRSLAAAVLSAAGVDA